MTSESITPRFSTMTNETGSHDEGAAETGIEDAAIAAITSADPAAAASAAAAAPGEPTAPGEAVASAEVEPAPPPEPKPPSFDDMGLHPDVRLALDDMGYFHP